MTRLPTFGGFCTSLLFESSDFEDGWIGSWSPGIGDPTFIGWFTVVAYFVASYLCLRVFRKQAERLGRGNRGYAVALVPIVLALFGSRRRLAALPPHIRSGGLWLGLSILLFLLGINKQLDLQTALTEVGRMLAHQEGWYENRRIVQEAFIGLVALVSLWGLVVVWMLARGSARELRGVLAGMVFLLAFVTVRAASFHHIDRFLGLRFVGFKMNWILELSGIGFIGFEAYRSRARLDRATPRPSAAPKTPAPPRSTDARRR